jgi:hypothetical protein
MNKADLNVVPANVPCRGKSGYRELAALGLHMAQYQK